MYKWTRDDVDFLRCYGIAVWLHTTREQLPRVVEVSEKEEKEYQEHLQKWRAPSKEE